MHTNVISGINGRKQEANMDTAGQVALADQALLEIDQLLNNYDLGGQLESVLPLLRRHRRTLTMLCNPPQLGLPAEEPSDGERWVDDIVTVFMQHGGQAPHPVVYRTLEQLRTAAGRSWPLNARSAIREQLQAHNAESPQYRSGADLFRVVQPGLWRLKDFDPR
jgi:hypothetical protein